LQENSYWMRTIGTSTRLDIPLETIHDPYGDHRVTPAECKKAART